jgi:hypothetical protein
VGRGARAVDPHAGQERLRRRGDCLALRVDRRRRKEPHRQHAELSCGACGGRSRVRAAWRAARGGEAAKTAGARARLNLSVGSMGVFAAVCAEARQFIVLYIHRTGTCLPATHDGPRSRPPCSGSRAKTPGRLPSP